MDFQILRDANVKRHQEWVGDGEVPLSFRGLELAGESGEACNELKKLERHRLGLVGGKAETGSLADELADVMICVDLIAMDLGIDLGKAIAKKFNATSEKYQLKTRIE